MDKKVLSFLLLMICHSIFDTQIKKVTEYSVNLDILYHGSWFCFALFWWYDCFKHARLTIERSILIVILIYLGGRLSLNLLSINKNYEQYSNLVSNESIDYSTWVLIVIAIFILIKWKRYIV